MICRRESKDAQEHTLLRMNFARWANLSVLKVSAALLWTNTDVNTQCVKYKDNRFAVWFVHRTCIPEKIVFREMVLETYLFEGLTVAITVVLELPPRESCSQNKYLKVKFSNSE